MGWDPGNVPPKYPAAFGLFSSPVLCLLVYIIFVVAKKVCVHTVPMCCWYCTVPVSLYSWLISGSYANFRFRQALSLEASPSVQA
jgi:hypothetical protein